jgi:hypothetical protein
MERTGPDDITKSLTIRTLHADGRLEHTLLRPITEEKAAGYHSLGIALGTDLGTLLMSARKHCPGFVERVAAYSVTALPDGLEIPVGPDQILTAIEFYERGAK